MKKYLKRFDVKCQQCGGKRKETRQFYYPNNQQKTRIVGYLCINCRDSKEINLQELKDPFYSREQLMM